MRLIDADALMEQTELICTRYGVRWTDNRVMAWIDNAPTVDAVPVVHGRWVDRMVRYWCCSECGEEIHKVRNVDGYCYDDKPNYCPNCGARMDGDANG